MPDELGSAKDTPSGVAKLPVINLPPSEYKDLGISQNQSGLSNPQSATEKDGTSSEKMPEIPTLVDKMNELEEAYEKIQKQADMRLQNLVFRVSKWKQSQELPWSHKGKKGNTLINVFYYEYKAPDGKVEFFAVYNAAMDSTDDDRVIIEERFPIQEGKIEYSEKNFQSGNRACIRFNTEDMGLSQEGRISRAIVSEYPPNRFLSLSGSEEYGWEDRQALGIRLKTGRLINRNPKKEERVDPLQKAEERFWKVSHGKLLGIYNPETDRIDEPVSRSTSLQVSKI